MKEEEEERKRKKERREREKGSQLGGGQAAEAGVLGQNNMEETTLGRPTRGIQGWRDIGVQHVHEVLNEK